MKVLDVVVLIDYKKLLGGDQIVQKNYFLLMTLQIS